MKKNTTSNSLIVSLIIILILAACASPKARTTPPQPQAGANEPLTSTEPTETSAAPAVKLPSANCSSISLGESIPMVMDAGRGVQVSPRDPTTGKKVCGVQDLSFKHTISYAYSNDRSRLAIVAYDQPDFKDGVLYLIDTNAWQAITTTVRGLQNTSVMAFDMAGAQLAMIENLIPPSTGAPLAYRLNLVDLAAQKITAHIPLNYTPQRLKFSTDGSSLAVFGGLDQAPVGIQPPARAQLFQASDLSLVWEAPLKGVLAGFSLPKTPNSDPLFDVWTPGVAFSADGSLLYIVHSDANLLTRVDFVHRSTTDLPIRPKLSWLDWLIDLTATGVAYAKGMNGTMKQAALSPDGKRLYVLGMTNEAWLDDKGKMKFDQTYLGLQVIDPETGTELDHLDTQASSFYLSPDGAWLFLNIWQNLTTGDVVDANTLQVTNHVDRASFTIAYRLDGQPVILIQTQPNGLKALSEAKMPISTKGAWRVNGYPLVPMP